MARFHGLLLLSLILLSSSERTRSDNCNLIPAIHVLKYPGCIPKPVPSFACRGKCNSYVQVSGSKIWQIERSCNCCQESGVREAVVSLRCTVGKYGKMGARKVVTRAPIDCMCRPCTAVDEANIKPQEMVPYED